LKFKVPELEKRNINAVQTMPTHGNPIINLKAKVRRSLNDNLRGVMSD